METGENYNRIQHKLRENVQLVVVTKTRSRQEILEIYLLGHRIFGENKVQELISKQPMLPADIWWHFIGHLQSNKVKYIAPFVHLIESVDSLKLLNEINRQALKSHRVIDCLLQMYIASEETKFGLTMSEAEALLYSDDYKAMQHIRIRGVMGMASLTDDMTTVRMEFRILKNHFDRLKAVFFANATTFAEISMGMSGDWEIGVEEGATIIRIGTAIFGERK